jgi:hypothetical protein
MCQKSIPHLVLKNILDSAISATPRFLSPEGVSGKRVELPPVLLAAGEAREVDLAPLMAAATGRDDFRMASAEVENDGPAGRLIGALCRRGKATSMSYEVPLRDSGPARSSTGSYPWRVDGDYSTLVTITNLSQKQALFTVVISYPDGQYILGLQKIEAGATAIFDLNKIQSEQIANREGQTILRSVTGGQFLWSVFTWRQRGEADRADANCQQGESSEHEL